RVLFRSIIVGQLAEHISGMGAPESDTACPRRNISHRNLFPFADMIAQMDQVSMPICTDEKLFFTDACHGNIREHTSVGIQHQRERHRTWSFRYLIGFETLKLCRSLVALNPVLFNRRHVLNVHSITNTSYITHL